MIVSALRLAEVMSVLLRESFDGAAAVGAGFGALFNVAFAAAAYLKFLQA